VTILGILAIFINHQSLIKPTCMLSEDWLPEKRNFDIFSRLLLPSSGV